MSKYLKMCSKVAKFEVNKSEQSKYKISIDGRIDFVFEVLGNRSTRGAMVERKPHAKIRLN